jgi:hypothetical protein
LRTQGNVHAAADREAADHETTGQHRQRAPVVQRLIAAPQRADNARKRTYKTKGETDKTRNITSTIVLTLLFISVVVPMLQYWGYTSKE